MSARRGLLLAVLLAACSPACAPPPAAPRRVEIRAVGPEAIELVPAEGQPPFCLVFTVSEKRVVRQLTIAEPNESVPCPAGAPIGETRYRIPKTEGPVKIHVVFSDRGLDARPIAAQMHELGASPGFSAMDLRAPGNVALVTLDFTPGAGR